MTWIGRALVAAQEALLGPVGALLAAFRQGGEGADSAAFTIGVIALSAKMARADGAVTRDEVAAFRRLFEVPPDDEARVARIFDLAKRDVAGFETYAAQIAGLFQHGSTTLRDLLDALFVIALADRRLHPDEEEYLRRVAAIFGFDDAAYELIRRRHYAEGDDPWAVLGVPRGASAATVRAAWRRLAAERHPDRLMGAGASPAEVAHAGAELARINAAYNRVAPRPVSAG